MSRLYILTVCIRVSSSFSFFANSLMSSMYIKWWTFSCDLLSLYPAVHFLSMWLSGIMAIMNSKCDRAFPWKIPLWIFASANLPPVVNSTHQVFIVLLTPWEFFTSALADGLSLEFEVQQVSSSLQDSSGRSQQCCSLDGLQLSLNFQVLQSFSYSTKSINHNCYNCNLHVP